MPANIRTAWPGKRVSTYAQDPYNVGERFGKTIADLVRTSRAFTVTIASVDADNAYVYMFGTDTPLPVPLAFMGGMLRITPNVGSLSVIVFLDGNDNTPVFIAHSEPDMVELRRGGTIISWDITPPDRDDNGDPVDGDTDDKIDIQVGGSTLHVDTDVWEFNGGTLGGLVVVNKLTQRLNQLETQINQIQSAISAHSHAVSTTGSSSAQTGGTTSTVYSSVTLTQFDDSDYVNEKITQ